MTNTELLDEIKRLKAIADVGLLYCNNDYDKERYSAIQEISFKLLNLVSGQTIESLKTSFPLMKDYPTPKVDIRGLLLSDDKKVLLVKESTDGKWSLPGGWADIGETPKEVIVKEFKEETGLDVIPKALLAVFDKRMHAHPPQPFYVYKMVFYCEAASSQINKGFDVLDVQYYNIENLPVLSEDRILKTQLELVYKKAISSNYKTYFD
jgi:ADP-ribose pyrophosphatase YjhB (NUDIX family)